MPSESHTRDQEARRQPGPGGGCDPARARGGACRLRRRRARRRRAAHAAGRRAARPAPTWSSAGAELTGRLAHRLRPGAEVVDAADPEQDAGALINAAQAGQVAVRVCTGDPLLFSRAGRQADCVRQGGGAAGDRARCVRRHRGARLRRHPADRRRRRHAGGARLRRQPDGRAGARQPGHPRRGERADRCGQDADGGRMGGHHPVRDHLERHHHRPAHRDQHARIGGRRPESRRGECADRVRPGGRGGR